MDHLTDFAIALLFFLHGAKLSREAVLAAAGHWRLHALVLLTTFVLFPLFGLAFRPILSPLATPALYVGILFLCSLPSTVQSSIAFTAIAKGNVPAAICSASASSIVGIYVTPLVAGLVLSNHGGAASGWDAIGQITLQLFVPFVCGQLLQPFIGGWIGRHDGIVGAVDQGSILLIVYSAFSAAISEGLWHQVPPAALEGLVVADGILLGAALITTGLLGKWLGFDRADRVAIIFCGSKKPLPGRYHGESYLCFPWGGCSDPPADGLPSDSIDGLRRAGPAMGSSCRALCTRLDRGQIAWWAPVDRGRSSSMRRSASE
ncbi:bile acid:sodium symporter family protein [Bradyrhizobium sp. 173]|uniref:bile acid:sodium symporter family protein n=1 Tax=unclassified Bradyrhizobium TaxID=2631580 RepID=UPI001FF7EE19